MKVDHFERGAGIPDDHQVPALEIAVHKRGRCPGQFAGQPVERCRQRLRLVGRQLRPALGLEVPLLEVVELPAEERLVEPPPERDAGRIRAPIAEAL